MITKKQWTLRLIAVSAIVMTGVAYYVYCVPSVELAPHIRSMARVQEFTVWEGFPHQNYEHELLQSELATKPFIKFHGFPFYVKQQKMSPVDVQNIRRILSSTWSYHPPRGYTSKGVTVEVKKTCGAYHPDYAIEWTDSDGTHQVHLCFGCGDLKRYDTEHEEYHELTRNASSAVQKIFKHYRDQRPKIAIGGPFMILD
jgi:hypothetical protein